MPKVMNASEVELPDLVQEALKRLSEKELKKMEHCVGYMKDMIDRQAAIDAFNTGLNELVVAGEENSKMVENYLNRVIEKIKCLPPAADVPDTNVGKILDTISRQPVELMPLPSAQPEIIRCKDCKHWMPYEWMFSEVWQSKNIADYPEDDIGCDCCDMAMKANDFCSRVERREVTK